MNDDLARALRRMALVQHRAAVLRHERAHHVHVAMRQAVVLRGGHLPGAAAQGAAARSLRREPVPA